MDRKIRFKVKPIKAVIAPARFLLEMPITGELSLPIYMKGIVREKDDHFMINLTTGVISKIDPETLKNDVYMIDE